MNTYEIPKSINLYQIFTEHDLPREIKHIPKYEYFLHLIYRKQKHTGNYVKLSTKLLRKVISYAPVLSRIKKILKSLDIIDINNSYQAFNNCKGYNIKEQYMIYELNKNLTTYIEEEGDISSLMWLGFFDDPILKEKQEKRYNKIQHRVENAGKNRFKDLLSNPNFPQYNYIMKNINRTTVDPIVYSVIQQMLDEKRKIKPTQIEFMVNGKKIKRWRKSRYLTKPIADSWVGSIQNVDYGISNISVSCLTNRLYCSVTSYPGEFRKYLRCDDLDLWYIDIRNSQPFLFLYFILNELQGEITEDVQKYMDLVRTGKLYEHLMKELNRTDLLDKDNLTLEEEWELDCKRSMFKIDFFSRIFFGKGDVNSKERQEFDKCFPTVSRIISKMKKDNYKDLSIKLQRFESSLILDRVFYRLVTEYPNSYALPVHDAVICESRIKDIVCKLMLDEITNEIGVTPSLSVKKLSQ
jgi:hypothetical protein